MRMKTDKETSTIEIGMITETFTMIIQPRGMLNRVGGHRGEGNNLMVAFELGQKIKRKLSNDQPEPSNYGYRNNRDQSEQNSVHQDRQSQSHREGKPFYGSRYSFVF